MGIINTRKPKTLTISLNERGFIEQYGQADVFKKWNFFYEVMITKNGNPWGSDGSDDFFHHHERLVLRRANFVVIVAGEHGKIVGEIGEVWREGLCEWQMKVAMKIGELKKPEAFKGWRKRWQEHLIFDNLKIKVIGKANTLHLGDPKEMTENAVNGHDGLNRKNANALMHLFCPEESLLFQSSPEAGVTHPCGKISVVRGTWGFVRRHGTIVNLSSS